MDDADPATQALIRKLHREMNGLGRRSARGGSAPPGKGKSAGDDSGRPSRRKDSGSRHPHRHRSSQGQDRSKHSAKDKREQFTADVHGRRPRDSTDESSRSNSEDEDDESSRDDSDDAMERDSPPPAEEAAANRRKKIKIEHEAAELRALRNTPEPKAEPMQPPKPQPKPEPKQEPMPGPEPSLKAPAKSERQEESPSDKLSKAAAAAALQAKERARRHQAANGEVGGTGRDPYKEHGLVKCFHSDVRWGLTLPADAIRTRDGLGEALRSALGCIGLPCSPSGRLHVLFLDDRGTATEFPPLSRQRTGDDKQPAESKRWEAASQSAVRIYVR